MKSFITSIILIIITNMIITSCSTSRHSNYVMPYLDSRFESKNFVDSLKQNGIDTILLYHKKHGYYREYFVLWLDKSVLQVRKINATGIFEIANWNRNGFYRDKRIFSFYIKNHKTIDSDNAEKEDTVIVGTDTLLRSLPSHYPYVDIKIIIDKRIKEFHLPYGINSKLDNSIFHFARLIESTIYNLELPTYWKEAEKRLKYYPKNYDPKKEKWENWRQEQINNGEIWDDYYH